MGMGRQRNTILQGGACRVTPFLWGWGTPPGTPNKVLQLILQMAGYLLPSRLPPWAHRVKVLLLWDGLSGQGSAALQMAGYGKKVVIVVW